ncbi:MAG: cupin domain-containing protein [Candidatus Thermoplasmatota archaeon]|nr:cupin domain-containing protein [Candidatus Thermoplasmatota archaeon]
MKGWLPSMGKVNFIEKLSMFTDHWSPRVIAEMNDYQFKLVKIKGDFIWHNHSDTDEAFIVLEGTMFIELENEIIELNEGEMYVVLKGTDHKPYAKDECKIMLVEPKGVMNTGNKTSELTASNDVWI